MTKHGAKGFVEPGYHSEACVNGPSVTRFDKANAVVILSQCCVVESFIRGGVLRVSCAYTETISAQLPASFAHVVPAHLCFCITITNICRMGSSERDLPRTMFMDSLMECQSHRSK